MPGPVASMLWRRLEEPGHDVARLERLAGGWRLEGCAAWLGATGPVRLDYTVSLAEDWTTRSGTVRGFMGPEAVYHVIVRGADGWSLDGRPQPQVGALRDLDYGFTPATNLQQMRRMALRVGGQADWPVAWFQVGARDLAVLPQNYRRTGPAEYDYAAPSVPYRATLRVGENGFARDYPGGWVEEEPAGA